jgi:hypothetical protein
LSSNAISRSAFSPTLEGDGLVVTGIPADHRLLRIDLNSFFAVVAFGERWYRGKQDADTRC